MKFGDKLLLIRRERKVSQKQLGDALNVTQAAISSYEREKTQPDFETLKAICKFFGVSADYFIDLTD